MSLAIAWEPDKTPYWSHGDEWSNEFTSADSEPFPDDQWEDYLAWSQKPQTGVIIGATHEFVIIRLTEPGPGGRTVVSYPVEDDAEDK